MSKDCTTTDCSSKTLATQGADFHVHNFTPFLLKKVAQYHYQVQCDFPDTTMPNTSHCMRVEFGVIWLREEDDQGIGIYSLDTYGGLKYIAFQYDKANSRFNIWVDFCERKGTLIVKENIKRIDFGFRVNNSYDFTLFYNKATREFSTQPNLLS